MSLAVLIHALCDGACASCCPCAEIMCNVMDCMDFLNLDQPTESKPIASCCTAFDSVLTVSPVCICESVKTASEIGLSSNMTRAAQLPRLCSAAIFDNSICNGKNIHS
ncbi:hypothetical protein MLD38_024643 [Melastoma candidum]|uniref:Uncharacterized protein n=1 Tax=Melastoma candidum TaxID=119954 RepID=A0ACB9NSL9_9MYRT|nr:hypothetical protein MLD38_024643 [Melastoma candidum]